LQPEHALDDWRLWGAGLRARPEILATLGGGRSNHSFLLNSNIGKLVLRINGENLFLPGAARNFESGIWRTASLQGIAPPLVHADNRDRYLVSRYVESRLPASPRSDATVVNRAFGLLEKCHRLEVSAPVIDYASHIERYWQMIETGRQSAGPVLERQREPMRSLLASLVDNDTPTGLCHHDLVIENFVGAPDRLYLIDWEYAATGLQVMDYAAFATEWQIDETTVLARTGLDMESFRAAKALYGYLCALWEVAVQ